MVLASSSQKAGRTAGFITDLSEEILSSIITFFKNPKYNSWDVHAPQGNPVAVSQGQRGIL